MFTFLLSFFLFICLIYSCLYGSLTPIMAETFYQYSLQSSPISHIIISPLLKLINNYATPDPVDCISNSTCITLSPEIIRMLKEACKIGRIDVIRKYIHLRDQIPPTD